MSERLSTPTPLLRRELLRNGYAVVCGRRVIPAPALEDAARVVADAYRIG